MQQQQVAPKTQLLLQQQVFSPLQQVQQQQYQQPQQEQDVFKEDVLREDRYLILKQLSHPELSFLFFALTCIAS